MTNEEVVSMLLANKAIKPGSDRPWEPGEFTSQKIIDLVGIRERRWVTNDQNTSDLALVAAEKALAEAGIGCVIDLLGHDRSIHPMEPRAADEASGVLKQKS